VVSNAHWGGSEVDLSGSDVSLRNARGTLKSVRAFIPSVDARANAISASKEGLLGTVSVDVPEVNLESLTTLNGLVPLPQGVSIEGGRAQAKIRLDVDVARIAGTGEVHVDAQRLRIRIGAETMEGSFAIALHASQRQDSTDLAGSTAEFKSNESSQTMDWWGRVELPTARFSARDSPRLRAQLVVQAKDASPLAAAIASNTAIPKWVLDAISTKGFAAEGEIVVAPSTLEARSVNARGAGVDLGFEFAKLGGEKEWALLVDIGLLTAGVDTANGKTDVLLFGARPWFREKTASLRALERRYE